MDYSFRFLDEKLNHRLIDLLKKSGISFTVDAENAIHYSREAEEFIENEAVARIRRSVFSQWQIISCPSGSAPQYKEYMLQHDVPFVEELIDRRLCFLIPRSYRPHSWKLGRACRKVS
jgi:hypothetical protein